MNEPFAAERSRGTNQQSGEQMTYWDPVHHLLSNLEMLYHVMAQLKMSHYHMKGCVE